MIVTLSRQIAENLSTLIDLCQFNRFIAISLNKEIAFAFSVINALFVNAKEAKSIVENLTKIMKNLKLSTLRALNEKKLRRIVRQKSQNRVSTIESYVLSTTKISSTAIVSSKIRVHVNTANESRSTSNSRYELSSSQLNFLNYRFCDDVKH